MPVQRRRTDGAPKRNPIRDAIATCAYERFVAHGRRHGHDLDDWLAAEREFVRRQARPLEARHEVAELRAITTFGGEQAERAR
jgi:hypothetical protein